MCVRVCVLLFVLWLVGCFLLYSAGTCSLVPPLVPGVIDHLSSLSTRAMQHAKKVSWLRKTEYIASEYNRTHTSNDMAESTLVN